MKQKFYICKHCGNIVAMIRDAGVPIMCCGEKIFAHSVDISDEEYDGNPNHPQKRTTFIFSLELA